MSEEVKNSEVNVPRSMYLSIVINGIMCFAILLAFLFCAGPLDQLVQTDSQYPFIDILTNNLGSAGAAVLVSLIIVMNFCCTFASISSGSRMVWSFARDQGLPFWQYIRLVSDYSRKAKPNAFATSH